MYLSYLYIELIILESEIVINFPLESITNGFVDDNLSVLSLYIGVIITWHQNVKIFAEYHFHKPHHYHLQNNLIYIQYCHL